MASQNEIIVNGYSNGSTGFDIYGIFGPGPHLESSTFNPRGDYMGTMGGTFSGNMSAGQMHATTNALVTGDASKDAAIKDAAMNVTMALAKIDSYLSSLSSSTPIFWDNKTETVGQALTDLHNTQWNVGDFPNTGNQGVGQSIRGANGGPNVDNLDYHAFQTGQGYAAATYTNSGGLVGILEHELGHLGQAGLDNLNDENFYFHYDYPQIQSDMYNQGSGKSGDYARDNEMFANDFQQALTSTTGTNVGNFVPAYGYGAISALGVYREHHENHHNIVEAHPGAMLA